MAWPGIETDALGDLGTISLDPTIYTDASVFRTAYWLTERFFIFLDREGDRIRVEIRNKPGSATDLQLACAEFCNALVDYRLRDIVAGETNGIREALIKQAFLQGVPKPGLGEAKSNEKHLSKAEAR